MLIPSIELVGPAATLSSRDQKSQSGITDIVSEDSLRWYILNCSEPRYWTRVMADSGARMQWGVIVPTIHVCRLFNLTFLSEVDRVLSDARGWGEDILKEYVQLTAKDRGRNGFVALEAVITLLVIASFAERVTPEIRSKLGPGAAMTVLDITLKYKNRKKVRASSGPR